MSTQNSNVASEAAPTVSQDEVNAALAQPDEPTEGLIGGFAWPTSVADPDEVQPNKPGEPAHGAVHPDLAKTDQEAGAVAPAPTSASPLFRGLNKEVKTPEELVAYATELERKVIENEAKLSVYGSAVPGQAQSAATTSAPAKAKKNYAEKMFVDPEATIAELRQDILSEVNETQARQNADKAFWDAFRNENPDLADAPEIVDLMLDRNRKTWDAANLTRDQIKKALASEARTYVKRIVESRKPAETLPSGKSSSLPASGDVPRRPVIEEAPKSFSQQILSLRKGKKRVG